MKLLQFFYIQDMIIFYVYQYFFLRDAGIKYRKKVPFFLFRFQISEQPTEDIDFHMSNNPNTS